MSGIKIILHIDDDPDDRFLVNMAIKSIDASIIFKEASNGIKALELLQQSKVTGELPCLIILDLNMPLMNGYKTYKEIRKDKAFDEIPVVVFTTSSSADDAQYWEKENIKMITKAAKYSELTECVMQMLGYCS